MYAFISSQISHKQEVSYTNMCCYSYVHYAINYWRLYICINVSPNTVDLIEPIHHMVLNHTADHITAYQMHAIKPCGPFWYCRPSISSRIARVGLALNVFRWDSVLGMLIEIHGGDSFPPSTGGSSRFYSSYLGYGSHLLLPPRGRSGELCSRGIQTYACYSSNSALERNLVPMELWS